MSAFKNTVDSKAWKCIFLYRAFKNDVKDLNSLYFTHKLSK